MKLKFNSKEEAVAFYKDNSDRNFTKGETIILYKAIVGQAPKKGKATLDMLNSIEKHL